MTPAPGPDPAEVSRETSAPPPPPSAVDFFGARLPLVVAYADLLAGPGVERGLIGPREVPRLWERHLLNCAVVAELVPTGAAVDDVGSGAGLPGIVLALHRPDLRVTLVEPLLRRAVFLAEVVATLGIGDRVLVERSRAEDRAAAGPTADVVTARAVAGLDRLARWTLPLLRPGGVLLAFKGAGAAQEVEQASQVLSGLGAQRVEVVRVGVGTVEPATTVVRVTVRGGPVAVRGRGGRR